MTCCTYKYFTYQSINILIYGNKINILKVPMRWSCFILLPPYITPNLFSLSEGGSFSARASGLTSTAVSSVSLSQSKCTRCCNSYNTVVMYWGEKRHPAITDSMQCSMPHLVFLYNMEGMLRSSCSRMTLTAVQTIWKWLWRINSGNLGFSQRQFL